MFNNKMVFGISKIFLILCRNQKSDPNEYPDNHLLLKQQRHFKSCYMRNSQLFWTCCKSIRFQQKEEVVSVKIPAGVVDGMQLRVQGKGNSGPMGGPAGDLMIVIEETPHADLTRDGENVHYELFVSFPDAALGTTAEVPTIGGKARIKVEAGVQSGKILRLKGKGLPSLEGYGRGDQLIHINVWTPKKLSKEQEAMLEALRNDPNFSPQPAKSDL